MLKIGAVLSGIALAFGAISLAVASLLGPLAITRMIFNVLGPDLTLLQKALGWLLKPLRLLTGAFIRLGIAILTTPIGWIMMAIALVAGAVYLIYKNWDTIGPWFKEMWGKVGDFFATLPAKALEWGSSIIKSLGDGISQQWEALKNTLKGYTDWLPDWWQGGDTNVTYRGYGTDSPAGTLGGPAAGTATAPYSHGTPAPLYKPAALKSVASQSSNTTIHAPIALYQLPGESSDDFAKRVRVEVEKIQRGQSRKQNDSTRDNH